jgi:hypothetical protein
MGDKISFTEVPARIIRRYFENFNYLMKQLSKLL